MSDTTQFRGSAVGISPPCEGGQDLNHNARKDTAMSFDYLLSKIAEAKFETEPFRHVYVRNFFDASDFAEIVKAPEILVPAAESDEQVFQALFDRGYKIINFPGCITDKDVYKKWHKEKKVESSRTHSACEGFGITLRLVKPASPTITELFNFMNSDRFQDALAAKFGIRQSDVRYDTGIQKYLDGYEISPHPDVRAKALTYMININPGSDSETRDHHTHYLRFREEFKYIQAYWDGHPNQDRFWVPWDWCDSVKTQSENNSLVIFAPDNASMHGVRASYSHLAYQRTQMYGNFWYKENKWGAMPKWEDFVFSPSKTGTATSQMSLKVSLKAAVPVGVKQFIKKNILGKDKYVLTNTPFK